MVISVCALDKKSEFVCKERTNIDRFFQCTAPFVLVRDQQDGDEKYFALADLWDFYSKPGGVLVEFKKDRETRVKVYFVPYLSAMQIFIDRKYSHAYNSVINSEGEESVHVNNKAGDNSTPLLLFQYFEREPPERREPLFPKVKKLGEACEFLFKGNNTILHNDSWYCVVWSPILLNGDAAPFKGTIYTFHHFRLRHKQFYEFNPLFSAHPPSIQSVGSFREEVQKIVSRSGPITIPRYWKVFTEKTYGVNSMKSGDKYTQGKPSEGGGHLSPSPKSTLSEMIEKVDTDVDPTVLDTELSKTVAPKKYGFVTLYAYFSFKISNSSYFVYDEKTGLYYKPIRLFLNAIRWYRKIYMEWSKRYPDYDYCAERDVYLPRLEEFIK